MGRPSTAPSLGGIEVSARGGFEGPFKMKSSAPLVTKLENRFRLFPPRRLRRIAESWSCWRNHSPVFCGNKGRKAEFDVLSDRDVGTAGGGVEAEGRMIDARGVAVCEDASRVCTESSGSNPAFASTSMYF